jgi:hypothetical protein
MGKVWRAKGKALEQLLEVRPVQASLAAPIQDAVPVTAHLLVEAVERAKIAAHAVVLIMPSHHPVYPALLEGHGLMHPSPTSGYAPRRALRVRRRLRFIPHVTVTGCKTPFRPACYGFSPTGLSPVCLRQLFPTHFRTE